MIENDSREVDWETWWKVHEAVRQYWENAEKAEREQEMNEQNENAAVPVMYVPASQVHKAVRNILANECGLTREKIAEMVNERVDTAVRARVNDLFETKRMEEFVAKQIGVCLGGTSWSSTPLKDALRDSIQRHISQLVGSSLKVEMHLSHDPAAKESK